MTVHSSDSIVAPRSTRIDGSADDAFLTTLIAAARQWAEQGAQWLHLVDLDGAVSGRPVNREAIEAITDNQQRPMITAIGEYFEELVALLTPWRSAILAGNGYPGRAFVERQGERAKQA